ncbi:helix-turn-helix domain-containing protein [Parageobacillus galactosidasius]|uniref:Excisionase n=1 Tax=Parageobacillus galactosidasius TaxID=883812 RepID=A0A226QNZ9_9BACL|nr:helix-turn-helix domain-containing protein [Parageobacillus galactosidasius]OXB94221.1 excisionase [Parageobacillus galactosidasius]
MYKNEDELPITLTAEDIKEILQIGITNAYELLNSGQFHVVKIGRQLRVSKTVFLKWLNGTNEVG